MELTARPVGRSLEATTSRQQVVNVAEEYLRAHIDTPIPVSRLCRIAGLSERGLRDAFYSVRGMSPKQWMTAERLEGVRRTLRHEFRAPMTVTGVATEYGFYELGRFAASYRRAFGEAPSETLRHRSSVEIRAAMMKGHSDAPTRSRNNHQ